jgi:tripartite-type tricarboxylate transporter receptor subunit TctC
VAPPLAFLPHYRNKELKIIAVTSSQRLNALPDVPTLTEDGIDFVRSGWLGVCAPAGTPAPIIQTLNRDITSIVNSNDYRGLIENSGSIAESSTPAGLETIMQQTLTEVAPTIAEFHLQRE